MTIIDHVRLIYRRALMWWHGATREREVPPVIVAEAPEPQPLPAPPPPRKKQELELAAGKYDLESGEFYFREAILDKLDYYFSCLKRVRKHDPESYDLYSRVGAMLMPQRFMDESSLRIVTTVASAWFRHALPSFGAVFYGDVAQRLERERQAKGGDDAVWPRMFYFRKYKRGRGPWEIEPVLTGDIYVLTVYWDKPEDKEWKAGWPTEFAVVVEPDGAIRLLRQLCVEHIKIRHKHGVDRGKVTHLERQVWHRGSRFLRGWAAEHKEKAAEMAQLLFSQATVLFEMAHGSMIQVSATKNDLTAAFSVNIKRTPYFFKDRELEVNENGNRKRIFHIVRPHIRMDGTAVKMHFRGAREFYWNGHHVFVTVPGLHHADVTDLSAGLIDEDARDLAKKGVSMAGLGDRIRKTIREGAAR
jgi:hypothetical protein